MASVPRLGSETSPPLFIIIFITIRSQTPPESELRRGKPAFGENVKKAVAFIFVFLYIRIIERKRTLQ
jgi:hypothetical protein